MNEKDLEKYENGRIIASILENKSKSYYLPLVQEKQLSKNVNTENIVQSLKETIKKLTDEKENLEEFLDSIDNENKTKLTKEEKDKMQKVCGDLTKKDNSLKKLKRLLGCFSDKVPDYYKFITLRWLVSDNGVKNDEKKNNEKDEVETLERDALILALSKFLKPEYVVNKTTEKNDKQKHLLCFLKDYHKDVASDFNDGSKIDLQYYAPNGIVLSNNDGEKKYILNSNGILFPASLSSVLEKNNALSDNNVKDKDKNAETDKKKVDNFVKGVKNMNEDEIKALIKQERAEHDIENLKLNNLVNDRMMQYMAQAMSFIPLLYNNQQMQNRKRVYDKDLRRFIILSKGIKGFDVTSKLDEIKCPVLIIGSKKDRVFDWTGMQKTAEQQGWESYFYEEYSHCVYDEAPDFKVKLKEFFSR